MDDDDESVAAKAIMKEKYKNALVMMLQTKKSNVRLLSEEKHQQRIMQLLSISLNGPKCRKDHDVLKRYQLQTIDGEHKLFRKGTQRCIVSIEESFSVIHEAHIATGHGARDVVVKHIAEKFANLTYESITLYLDLCETCQLKKSNARKGIVVKPIISNNWNSRCQVDLIDMQSRPDGEFKFILVYQDHLTKFCVLKATRSKTATEIAENLIDIFCIMGAPHILHTDNGREFENKLIKEVLLLWPQCKLIHGKPRHSQSQGSVERCNRDIEAKLACWMKDNKTIAWTKGLRFVQMMKNTCFHSGIGRSPYESLYGSKPKIGLSALNLPTKLMNCIEFEEDITSFLLQGVIQGNHRLIPNFVNTALMKDEIGADENTETELQPSENRDDNLFLMQGFIQDETMETELQPNENRNNNLCITCQKETSGAHMCKICKYPCHGIPPCCFEPEKENDESGFGSPVVCWHCHKKEITMQQRHASKNRMENQAEKMTSMSAKRLKVALVGQTVRVAIPEVDRGHGEFPNILAVILAEKDGFYQLRTKHGMLKKMYSRNQFELCNEKFIDVTNIDQSKEVSMREAAGKSSLLGISQGFFRCNCTTKCRTNRCRCLSANTKCNSKCHNSNTCCNK